MSESVWSGEQLDLDAYLERIGYAGDRAPTLETLRALQAAHVTAIGFENIDVLLGRPVALDVPSLQDKLVGAGRGGYCYEHNLLFAAALERLGFAVSGLGARIRMGEETIRPTTHALLKVRLDGADWITDTGFGGEALLAPLPLVEGYQERQGGWTFGLVRRDPEEPGGERTWVVRSLHPDGWFDLYSFGSEARYPADFAVVSHYMATHPRSPFVQRLVVQRPDHGLRRTLIGTELTLTGTDYARDVREVAAAELPRVLAEVFRITLTDADEKTLVGWYGH
ncbi:acetyltransferase [Streptomyces sp. Ru73]|uniref:arylamine N-acetyltransferase family protein n=1 Tax=Streptomyces sp. Ru73 TaxID=2080748 RepID=UPI000CDDF50E|nr:arylamine N-acetyltransferase [Streptomyces sp. Ru73]POX41971.1 acetyltransferase [Streptomyces sp. Ru73]